MCVCACVCARHTVLSGEKQNNLLGDMMNIPICIGPRGQFTAVKYIFHTPEDFGLLAPASVLALLLSAVG